MPELVAGTTLARGFSGAVKPIWPLVRAGDLFELRYGKALVEANRRSGLIPVFGTNGQCGWHDTPLFKGPGVILGRKGQGPLGVEWSESDYWVIDTAYSLSIRHTDVDLRFAYYLIKYVGLNHLKDGTSNPSLSRDTFAAQALPIPPPQDQRRIAELLRALDDKIELNRRMSDTLEAMARTLFKSWFIDFDPVRAKMERRSPAHMDSAVAALFPSTFEQSVSRGWTVPTGWDIEQVADAIEALYDGPHATPPESGTGAVFLGIKNFRPAGLDLSNVRRIAEEDWPRWTKRVTPAAGYRVHIRGDPWLLRHHSTRAAVLSWATHGACSTVGRQKEPALSISLVYGPSFSAFSSIAQESRFHGGSNPA